MTPADDAGTGTPRADQARLVESLCQAAAYDHPVDPVTIVETHVSYVLLTGQWAYKIKKAVDLEFLDFRTLDARRFYCGEEIRLNRRFAPSLYAGVVAITGDPEHPAVNGSGTPFEYAVKMRQFSGKMLLSDLLARGELTASHADDLAFEVAGFHTRIAGVPPPTPFGNAEAVLEPALENFTQLLTEVESHDRPDLEMLLDWTRQEHARCAALFERRRERGFVRECHGDLHLGNIVLIGGAPTLFDCLEFNASMRWIDVMNDVAFLVMDLHDHQRPDLAWRFLNGYLERTGDDEGLGVLRFYVVYRAMVRAKIAQLRAAQMPPGADRTGLRALYHSYLELAARMTTPEHVGVVITHGVAGSGKTTCSQALVESIGAIRVRSDIERKRVRGSTGNVPADLYTDAMTRQTYELVVARVRAIATAGYVAIADATCLRRWQRTLFCNLAADLRKPFVIVSCAAPEATLRDRVAARHVEGRDASDATIAVLESQELLAEPLARDEVPNVVACETLAPERIAETVHQVAARLAG